MIHALVPIMLAALVTAIQVHALPAQVHGAVISGVVRDGSGAPIADIAVRFVPG